MIIVHTEEGIVYVVQEEDGVKIFLQEGNILLAEGELAEIGFGGITCTVKGADVWQATLQEVVR